jgi:quercetin dioxygenase-like cupin family protein
MSRVFTDAPVGRETGSELTLDPAAYRAGETLALPADDADRILLVTDGTGTLSLAGSEHGLAAWQAGLVLAGEDGAVTAGADGLDLVVCAIGPYVDRHAAIGPREVVVSGDLVAGSTATGNRSFQVLFGPHNGSTRATLFVGQVPPGRAPWHYHLYDEIVWVPHGPGRLHLESGVEELGPGAAFRLHPREIHIVENAGDTVMTVVGIFTPAGSPSAAYLPAGSEASYA